MKKFKNLREREEALCKRLELPPHDTSIGEIPTATQVKEIEANIEYMEKELVCRIQRRLPKDASHNQNCLLYLTVLNNPGLNKKMLIKHMFCTCISFL